MRSTAIAAVLFVILVVPLWVRSTVGVDDSVPEGWTLVDPPRSEAGWKCANYSMDWWSVALAGDSPVPIISSLDQIELESVLLEIDDGKFEGANHGEFGGVVNWIDASSGDTTTIFKGNPVAFVQSAEGIVLAAGLAHLGMAEGALHLLARDKGGKWNISPLVDLGDAPLAVQVVDADSILIVTPVGLQLVSLETRSRESLYQNENWSLVAGYSVARGSDGTIYVGMRRAVVRLTPELTPGT